MSINGTQSVSFEKGTIEFKNYFRQILIPFKLYANFECNLWVSVSVSVESYEGSYSKTYQDHIPCSFAYKFVCVDDKFTEPIVVFRGENTAYEFVKAILKEYGYCKKVMEKQFHFQKHGQIWSWVKKNNSFNQVTLAGFVKNSLIMTTEK